MIKYKYRVVNSYYERKRIYHDLMGNYNGIENLDRLPNSKVKEMIRDSQISNAVIKGEKIERIIDLHTAAEQLIKASNGNPSLSARCVKRYGQGMYHCYKFYNYLGEDVTKEFVRLCQVGKELYVKGWDTTISVRGCGTDKVHYCIYYVNQLLERLNKDFRFSEYCKRLD